MRCGAKALEFFQPQLGREHPARPTVASAQNCPRTNLRRLEWGNVLAGTLTLKTAAGSPVFTRGWTHIPLSEGTSALASAGQETRGETGSPHGPSDSSAEETAAVFNLGFSGLVDKAEILVGNSCKKPVFRNPKGLQGEGSPSGCPQEDGAWLEEVRCPHHRGGGGARGRAAHSCWRGSVLPGLEWTKAPSGASQSGAPSSLPLLSSL